MDKRKATGLQFLQSSVQGEDDEAKNKKVYSLSLVSSITIMYLKGYIKQKVQIKHKTRNFKNQRTFNRLFYLRIHYNHTYNNKENVDTFYNTYVIYWH